MDFEEELNRAVRPSPTLLGYPLQDGWPREVWGGVSPSPPESAVRHHG